MASNPWRSFKSFFLCVCVWGQQTFTQRKDFLSDAVMHLQPSCAQAASTNRKSNPLHLEVQSPIPYTSEPGAVSVLSHTPFQRMKRLLFTRLSVTRSDKVASNLSCVIFKAAWIKMLSYASTALGVLQHYRQVDVFWQIQGGRGTKPPPPPQSHTVEAGLGAPPPYPCTFQL